MKKKPKHNITLALSQIAIADLKAHGIDIGVIVECTCNDDTFVRVSSWDDCQKLSDGSIILNTKTTISDDDPLITYLYDAESGEYAIPISDSPVEEQQPVPARTPLPRIPAEKLQQYDRDERLWELELQRLKTCKFQISAQTIDGKLIIQRDHDGYSQLEMLGILDIMRSELLKQAEITQKD